MMFFVLLSLLCCISSSQCGRMRNCYNRGTLWARENETLRTDCYTAYLLYPNSSLSWGISPWRDQPSLEIGCSTNSTDDQGCSSHPEVNVSWNAVYLSDLTIRNIERDMFNSSTISCKTTPIYATGSYETFCLIDVVYYADVKSCNVEIDKPSWTLNGFCDVTKVYSSAGQYSCLITEKYDNKTQSPSIKRTVNNTGSLTSFTDTSSGYVYYRGRFPFSLSLPSRVGNVTYSVLVSPGTEEKDAYPTILIDRPSDPELTNCNQHTFMEGGNSPDTPCDCRIMSLGSPSGRLQWVADDVVLVSGAYGVIQLVFPYDKLTRIHDGMAVRCRVDWVVKNVTTSFTPRMIFGPDRADIFVHNPTNRNDDVNITFLCEAYNVNALSDVITTWGDLCQGQQGPMCTLTPPFERYVGKEVTCTATNRNIPGKQVTAKWIVKANNNSTTLSDMEGQTKTDKAMSFWEGVGIGVGVTLFVVLAVVGVMLVVLWRRHLLPACCIPTYASPSKKRQKEEEEQHTYTDLSNYQVVGNVTQSSTGAANTE